MLRRLEVIELTLCRGLNRQLTRPGVHRAFLVVSRLGDGVFWYVLILAMPWLTSWRVPTAAAHMAVTGLAASVLQVVLKSSLARERPFVTFPAIACGTAPLDRYSFPSGHTLHAVCFTTIAIAYVPMLAWILVPFTALVMASRVILGLHYPSDVVAGAVVGLALAVASRAAFGT